MSGRQSEIVSKALKMVGKGITPYAAAKKTGIALSTIYRAIKRNQIKTIEVKNGQSSL